MPLFIRHLLFFDEHLVEHVYLVQHSKAGRCGVGKICKVKREDRRRGGLREKIGMKKQPRMKVAGSRLLWAGHIHDNE